MSSTIYGAGTGTLGRGADLVASAKQDFDALSATLSGQLGGLEAQWQGAGGQAFFALHEAWTQKQRLITGSLDEFEQSLRATQRDNTTTDDERASSFAAFQQRLG